MMDPTSSRPVRKVAIAEHLWDAFAEMAQVMGSDREALINQAMFVFARLNGFLEGGSAARPSGVARAAETRRLTPTSSAAPTVQGFTPSGLSRAGGTEDRGATQPPRPADPSARRQVAERVLETAAELERMIQEQRDTRPDATDDHGGDTGVEGGVDALLERLASGPQAEPTESGLHLLTEGGEAVRVGRDRFVIGRGKHCDHVIHSSKVSREHVAITREGDEYFIEDLDSSNGTWFNKQRIKRRKVESGDEYYICSERIRLVLR